MEFASAGAFGRTWLVGEPTLGLAWAAGFALLALAVFRFRTRTRRHSTTQPQSATSTGRMSV